MRLDPQHVAKLDGALIGTGPDATINLDIEFMSQAFDRLTMWEQGLLTKVVMRAARTTRRRTPEQRALLALFVPALQPATPIERGGDDA